MTRLARAAIAAAIVAATPAAVFAQSPLRHWTDAIDSRFAMSQPVISYTLRVDSADVSGFNVSMSVRGTRDTVLLAMATHPEYDDRYWRFVRDVRVESPDARATVARVDSSLWRVVATGGSFTVHYRLALPATAAGQRQAWRPFLRPTGGLVGGPHSFMYVVGQTLAPAHVRLDLPAAWSIATGLAPTADSRTFYAPSALVLMESPMLVGHLRDWRFEVENVPHRVVYWPRPDASAFDSVALVGSIERLARQAITLFGRAPYRDYVFQLQDGAFGALEHPNSVTLGAPSDALARGMGPFLEEAAHEYFHAWNLMRIRPLEYADLTYRKPAPSGGLWFSEGLSMFYSDLLLRRAGLPVSEPTRTAHLEELIARYLSSPGNGLLSAQRVSEAEYGGLPDALGDYSASPHTQGELIGAMLDLRIRHATAGRRSMDDVMRLMLERHSGTRGFTGRDIERAVTAVCRCNVAPMFDAHVRSGHPIAFDNYLRLMGLRADVTWRPALGADGRPEADLRAYAYDSGDGPRLGVTDPKSAWGRAGLHSGDRIYAVNGVPMPTAEIARRTFRALRSGDTVRVDVEQRGGLRRTATVPMTPFDIPVVRLRDLPTVTAAQRALRARWESGQP